MNRASSILTAVAFVVALISPLNEVFAQNIQEKLSTTQTVVTTGWHPLSVKRVAPSMLASWLGLSKNGDAARPKSSNPYIGGRSSTNCFDSSTNCFDSSTNSVESVLFALPEGIESIVPVDTRNILLVLGTEPGIRELEHLIAFLDKPIPQLEIETHVIEMNAEDCKSLGLKFQKSFTKADYNPTVNFLSGNILSQLEELKKRNKTKFLIPPHMTVVNVRDTGVVIKQSHTARPSIKDTKGSYVDELGEGFFWASQFKLAVTPLLENDNITLTIAPNITLYQTNGIPGEARVVSEMHIAETIALVKDGGTIALTHLSSLFLAGPEKPTMTPDKLSVLFITPRIIRRVEDATPRSKALAQ